MTNFRIWIVGSALVSGLVLAGCSSSHTADASHSSSDHASASVAGVNSSDLNFVQMMVPHHQQAVEMSALAIDRTTNPVVLDLAERIGTAQGPEIDQMLSMLVRWGVMSEGDHSDHEMPGMIDAETMKALRDAKDADFDRLFLTSMIAHHQGAIDMAQDPLENGEDPELKALLDEIVTAQSAEIKEMQALLDSQN